MKLKRWEWLILAGVIVALFGVAWAADEAITVSHTAKTLTAAEYGGASWAMMVATTNGFRFTLDGVSTPTSAGVGILWPKDTPLTLSSRKHVVNFKAVRADATGDAILNATYGHD